MAVSPKSASQQLLRELDELEERIDETQRRYEMFFQGLERVEPAFYRDDCKRKIAKLKRAQVNNTAVRFKLEGLIARFTIHNTYWERTLKQIAEGTYKKHNVMADRRHSERLKKKGVLPGDELAAAKPKAKDEKSQPEAWDVDEADFENWQESAPERPAHPPTAGIARPAAPRPAERPAGPKTLTDHEVERLHRSLVTARRQTGEDVAGLTSTALRKSLEKQIPTLQQRYGDKDIQFKVVVKDGKAIVKAVPK